MKSFLLCVVFFCTTAFGFHLLQNSGVVRGGTVAGSKTAWLFSVIFYWYVLPIFWLLDQSLSAIVRRLLAVALFNMIARAFFELPMMYITDNWLHIYGIGHDIFSTVLCVALLAFSINRITPQETWVKVYLGFSAILFIAEAIFATYLRHATSANGSVFFLPADQNHSVMLGATMAMVIAIICVCVWLISRWRIMHVVLTSDTTHAS